MDLQNTIKVKNETKKLFMNKLEELIRAELSPKDETMDFERKTHKELTQIMKSKNLNFDFHRISLKIILF